MFHCTVDFLVFIIFGFLNDESKNFKEFFRQYFEPGNKKDIGKL